MFSLLGNVKYLLNCDLNFTQTSPLSKQTSSFFSLISLHPFTYHEPHSILQMRWLQSLFSPLKKLWIRLHSARKKSRGIYILYEDIKNCPYEDVHVLWSILVESHPPALPPPK